MFQRFRSKVFWTRPTSPLLLFALCFALHSRWMPIRLCLIQYIDVLTDSVIDDARKKRQRRGRMYLSGPECPEHLLSWMMPLQDGWRLWRYLEAENLYFVIRIWEARWQILFLVKQTVLMCNRFDILHSKQSSFCCVKLPTYCIIYGCGHILSRKSIGLCT